MSDYYEKLNEIRLELTACIIESQILFKKLSESDISYENVILTELGQKICKQTRKTCEDFENVLDNFKFLTKISNMLYFI